VDPVGRADDPHPTALRPDQLEPTDEDTQSGGVQEGDPAEIDDEVAAATVDRLVEAPP
jgi:hypothetical protein